MKNFCHVLMSTCNTVMIKFCYKQNLPNYLMFLILKFYVFYGTKNAFLRFYYFFLFEFFLFEFYLNFAIGENFKSWYSLFLLAFIGPSRWKIDPYESVWANSSVLPPLFYRKFYLLMLYEEHEEFYEVLYQVEGSFLKSTVIKYWISW